MSTEKANSAWVSALLVVKFHETLGQQVVSIYPPNNNLSQSVINDIKMLAMPDCIQSGCLFSQKYMVRVRDKSEKCTTNDTKSSKYDEFYNCYVAFQQRKDASCARGHMQQSLILVCKYPLVTLAYQLLSRLLQVLEDVPQFRAKLSVDPSTRSNSSSPNPAGNSTPAAPAPRGIIIIEILAILEVAYQHFLQWPMLQSGVTYRLPFYGCMFEYTVPQQLHPYSLLPLSNQNQAHDNSNVSTEIPGSLDALAAFDGLGDEVPFVSSADVEGEPDGDSENVSGADLAAVISTHYGGGVDVASASAGLTFNVYNSVPFAPLNLVHIFEPLGLLPHIWLLWESVVSGRDIVCWSPSAATCSQVVLALVSLISPLSFCGDYRPYMSLYDADTKHYSAKSRAKYLMKYKSIYGSRDSKMNSNSNSNMTSDGNMQPTESVLDCSCDARERVYTNDCDEFLKSVGSVDYTSCYKYACDIEEDSGNRSGSLGYASTSSSTHTSSGSYKTHPSSMIVGITNPFLLKDFNMFDVVMLLPNPDFLPLNSGGTDSSVGVNATISSTLNRIGVIGSGLSVGVGGLFAKTAGSNISTVDEKGKQDSRIDAANSMSSQVFENVKIPTATIKNVRNVESKGGTSPGCKTDREILSDRQIEDVYDKWVEHGGLSGKTGGIICLRQLAESGNSIGGLFGLSGSSQLEKKQEQEANHHQYRTIQPDVSLLRRIEMLSASESNYNVSSVHTPVHELTLVTATTSPTTAIRSAHYLTSNSRHHKNNPPLTAKTPGVVLVPGSDRSVIGNKFLRETFRVLTYSLVKPFYQLFSVLKEKSKLSHIVHESRKKKRGVGGLSVPTASLFFGDLSHCLPSKDDLDIIYNMILAITIDEYYWKQYQALPRALQQLSSVEFKRFLLSITRTIHFSAFVQWKRNLIVRKSLLDACVLSSNPQISMQTIIKCYGDLVIGGTSDLGCGDGILYNKQNDTDEVVLGSESCASHFLTLEELQDLGGRIGRFLDTFRINFPSTSRNAQIENMVNVLLGRYNTISEYISSQKSKNASVSSANVDRSNSTVAAVSASEDLLQFD